MAWLDKVHHPEKLVISFLKWGILGCLLGGLGGLIGALFHHVLHFVTLAAGFQGGEIDPTFCVGATFGCVLGGLLWLDPGIAGALGLVGLFCCATNSPFASIVLSIEMFGSSNLYLFALVCVICFELSGNSGLYASQIIRFDKASVFEGREKTEVAG